MMFRVILHERGGEDDVGRWVRGSEGETPQRWWFGGGEEGGVDGSRVRGSVVGRSEGDQLSKAPSSSPFMRHATTLPSSLLPVAVFFWGGWMRRGRFSRLLAQ